MYDKIQDSRSRWGLSKIAQQIKVFIVKSDDLSFGNTGLHMIERTISSII